MENAMQNKPEIHGIKETLELLDLMGVIAEIFFRARSNQGFSKAELVRYAWSEEFRDEVKKAFEGSTEAPKEWGDISWQELVAIGQHILAIFGRIAKKSLAA